MSSKVTQEKNKTHIPVLLEEAIDKLRINPAGFYIDCTLGEGGHSHEIYTHLSSGGVLASIDQDIEAIEFVKKYYKNELKNSNWQIEKNNFSNISQVAEKYKRKPDGILMDLGMSSRQLDEEKRGFSIREKTQSLDMRMDLDLGVKASDLLNALSIKDLEKLFREYGEENFAKRIAEQIKKSPHKIITVDDLLQCIYKALPIKSGEALQNSARRVFQALRIAVNDELYTLEIGIMSAYNLLNKGGRLVVISFHSLEDRIVKNFFKLNGKIITKKPIVPRYEEVLSNPRSHSAKMRVLEKI